MNSMWSEKIMISAPYDFDKGLNRLALDPLHSIRLEDRLIRVPIYCEQLEIAEVKAVGTVDDPAFIVTGAYDETKEEVLKQVSTIFQWDTPLQAITAHFSKTSLKDIFTIHYGTPLILEFSLFSCLIKSIIHQQLNTTFAHTLTNRFVHAFGYELDGVMFYPSPQDIIHLSVEELRELQFSQRKAEYIIDLAKAIVEDKLNLAALKYLPDESVIKELVKFRGIGPWTAQNFLLFGLGRLNLFPKTDIGIQRAVKQLFRLEKKPNAKQMERYAKEWEPYLSYASLYLWRSIE